MNGDDRNDGISASSAFASFAALAPALADEVRVGLARGSYWEEQLDTSAYARVVIDDYGDPALPMPTVDTTGVADDGDFSATGGTANVYQIAWPNDIASLISFLRVWEDGDCLTWATSVAACDATPGSCYYAGQAQASNPLTVYIHPKGSTNPASDGKKYRLSERDYAFFLGPHNTIRDCFARKGCHNGGPITTNDIGCRVERCITEWGNKHHSVLQVDAGGDAAWVGVVSYKQIPTSSQWNGGTNVLTAFRNAPAGGDFTIDGCVVYMPTIRCGGFLSHTAAGGAFGHVLLADNYIYGTSGSLNFGNETTHEIRDNYVENVTEVLTVYGARVADGITAVNMPSNYRLASIFEPGAAVTITDACLHQAAAPSGGVIWGASTDEYSAVLSHCSLKGGGSVLFSDDAATVASIGDCIFCATNMVNLQAAQPVLTADNNVYYRSSGAAQFITADINKSGLAAWQSFSGLDANSVEADPLFAGTLAEGDFSLAPGSPALTGGRDAGARKWRTRPDWAALAAQWDAGFYAHPTDAIGGSELVVRT